MAFIFVPNADGSFNEGDKQTNPDTGVEYIYTDGAWRALGPNIEDEFDTLDTRYVKKAGDTMTGGLQLSNSRNLTFKKADNSNQFAINPNVTSDYFTNIYTFNSAAGGGGVRFRISQDQGLGSGSYDTLLSLSGANQEIGGVEYRGTLAVNRVRTPTTPDQATNKWYVDNAIENIDIPDVDLSDYLPLSGGSLTGTLYVEDGAGDEKFRVQPSGFCRTNDLFRSERTDNGPAFQARNDGTLNAEIRCNGQATFKTSVKKDGKELATEEFVTTNALTGDFLPLSGGTLIGTLNTQLVKSTRNTGYAFEVKPNDSDTVALIRSVGTSSFKGVTIDSLMASGAERPFELKGRLADGSTISKDFFYMYANSNGTASAMNYNGKITSGPNIVNKTYVDNKVPGRFYMQSGSLYYES